MAMLYLTKCTIALCLCILLLMSTGITVHANGSERMKQSDGNTWLLSSLYDSFLSVAMGVQTDASMATEQDEEENEKDEVMIGASSKYESENAEDEGLNPSFQGLKYTDDTQNDTDQPETISGMALLLEQAKAHALEQQRLGVECIDCVDDGEGNFLPSSLVHAINMHKMKHQVDSSQAQEKKAYQPMNVGTRDTNDGKTSLQGTLQVDQDDNDDGAAAASRNLGNNIRFSSFHRPATNREFAPRWKRQHCKQIGKKNANGCRCEYPGENMYKGAYRDVGYKTVGRKTVLPTSDPACKHVKFLCPGDSLSGDETLWKCPIKKASNKPMSKNMNMNKSSPIYVYGSNVMFAGYFGKGSDFYSSGARRNGRNQGGRRMSNSSRTSKGSKGKGGKGSRSNRALTWAPPMGMIMNMMRTKKMSMNGRPVKAGAEVAFLPSFHPKCVTQGPPSKPTAPTVSIPAPSPSYEPTRCMDETLLIFEDFESGSAPEWSINRVESSRGFTSFLGRLGPKDLTSKKFFNIPVASSLKISFDFYEIDNWEDPSDCFFAYISDQKLDFGNFKASADEGKKRGKTDCGITWTIESKDSPKQIGFRNDDNRFRGDQIHRVVAIVPSSCSVYNNGILSIF